MYFASKSTSIVALIGIASLASSVAAAYESEHLDTRELDDFYAREVAADELLDLMERSPGIGSIVKSAAKTGMKLGKKAGRIAKKAIRPALKNANKAKGAADKAQEILANAVDHEGNDLDAANNKNFQIDIGIRDLDDIEEYERSFEDDQEYERSFEDDQEYERSFEDDLEERSPLEELEDFLESRELNDMIEELYERLGEVENLD